MHHFNEKVLCINNRLVKLKPEPLLTLQISHKVIFQCSSVLNKTKLNIKNLPRDSLNSCTLHALKAATHDILFSSCMSDCQILSPGIWRFLCTATAPLLHLQHCCSIKHHCTRKLSNSQHLWTQGFVDLIRNSVAVYRCFLLLPHLFTIMGEGAPGKSLACLWTTFVFLL